jgi:hypothetical protein
MSAEQSPLQAVLASRIKAIKRELNELEMAVQEASFALPKAASCGTHRSLHRPGRASKLDTDGELRSFVLERIETNTFQEIADEIERRFPRHRRVARSTIHAWWNRNGRP